MTSTSVSDSTLIDTTILQNMELRETNLGYDNYLVVQADLISAGDHDDLYSAVIKTAEGTFVNIFFQWNHTWEEVNIYGDDAGILAPKIVRPKTVTTVIYE